MSPPLRLAPDGLDTLAALIVLHGAPGPLSPALAAAVAAHAPDARSTAVDQLTTACARRRHLGPSPAGRSRAPAARFARRQVRRWRVQQGGAALDPARLARAGRRARRKGAGWPEASDLELGTWLAFWASDDPAQRHDLLAHLAVDAARAVMAHPLTPDTLSRLWR